MSFASKTNKPSGAPKSGAGRPVRPWVAPKAQIQDTEEPPMPRHSSNEGSAGGGGDNLDGRVAKLESGMEHLIREVGECRQDIRELRSEMRDIRSEIKTEIGGLRSDFRWMLAAYASGFMILLGVMAKGFHWL